MTAAIFETLFFAMLGGVACWVIVFAAIGFYLGARYFEDDFSQEDKDAIFIISIVCAILGGLGGAWFGAWLGGI